MTPGAPPPTPTTTPTPTRCGCSRPTSSTPPSGRRPTTSGWTSCSTAAAAWPTRPTGMASPRPARIPLLAEFQATDPTTGKPYADDFGWISHTYDTPVSGRGLRDPELHRGRAQREHQLGGGRPGSNAGDRRPRADRDRRHQRCSRRREPPGLRARQPLGPRRPGAREPGDGRSARSRPGDRERRRRDAGCRHLPVRGHRPVQGADSPSADQSAGVCHRAHRRCPPAARCRWSGRPSAMRPTT